MLDQRLTATTGPITGKQERWGLAGVPELRQPSVRGGEITATLIWTGRFTAQLLQSGCWFLAWCPGFGRQGPCKDKQSESGSGRSQPLAGGEAHSRCTINAANRPPAKPLAWPIQLTPGGLKNGSSAGSKPP